MEDISQLNQKFSLESPKNQLKLISQIAAAGESGEKFLREFLASQRSEPPSLVTGKIYQTLYKTNTPETRRFLETNFPTGIVPFDSERNIDYQPLQQLLAQKDFRGADVLTLQKLCELAGEAATKRKWLYFTEVDNFPSTDLRSIDRLWLMYSEGKFGFSVQRQLWLSLGQDFSQLWYKIGWKDDNGWTRYPKEFTWDLSAPKGHLPLSNQLRGVRVIASIFAHPVWSN
ncbi:MAG: GUN4 N-terminal ARM-like repeat domain-containing protein [Xenococcaceae cyanobacterium]